MKTPKQEIDNDQVINKLEIELRTMRLQKIENDQRFKLLQSDFDQQLQTNRQLKAKMDALQLQIQQMEKSLTVERLPAKPRTPPPKAAASINLTLSQTLLQQKSTLLEENVTKQTSVIKSLQSKVQQLTQELNRQQMMNQELYSHIVKMDMPDPNVKKSVLNDIEQQRKILKNNNIPYQRLRQSSTQPRTASPENDERQWNKLVIDISKLKVERRQLHEQIYTLYDELFKQSQFVLNLLAQMDRPDFIVNLSHIRNVCTQQRELLSDRMVSLIKERNQLQLKLD